jgi:hypothetical protein
MVRLFSSTIYDHWRAKQEEKYLDIRNLLLNRFNPNFKVVDIGIGKGWFYESLPFRFSKVIGVEKSPDLIGEKKPHIDYIFKPLRLLSIKADMLVSIDALHLIEPIELEQFMKASKFDYFLLSVPLRKKTFLQDFVRKYNLQIKVASIIGKEEQDFFVFAKAEE